MSTATEHHLFKLCVEQPLKLQLAQLNLQFVKDSSKTTESLTEAQGL